MSSKSI